MNMYGIILRFLPNESLRLHVAYEATRKIESRTGKPRVSGNLNSKSQLALCYHDERPRAMSAASFLPL